MTTTNQTSGLVVGGQLVPAPCGLNVRNLHDAAVSRFAGRSRSGRAVNEVVVHESVTRSAGSTVAVLQRRGLGVHLMVAPDGSVTQHGDLLDDRLAHAGGHNGPSVGLEVVNPYYPTHLREGLPWSRVIDAPWAHRDRYVLPTPEQAEATARLLGWLTSPEAVGLTIPRSWRGIADGQLAMGRVPNGDTREPGVWAHHYFHHADGAWPVLYAWLRLEAGLAPCAAYEEAVRRATGVRKRVDLADLVAPPAA
ncbi:MAG: N-acetylmuramoyl-L-alanine amidase [Myxococcales bacterium]|nr:N-acetylmuramoyl-L-alanine amidase [Myxococcales bacterium]